MKTCLAGCLLSGPRLLCSLPRSCPRAGLCFALALGLFLVSRGAQAQGSLSAPLSAPIGGSFYSESEFTGPSGSLLPGGSNLTAPFYRGGISDPLGFLIESGFMSPYLPGGSLVDGYAQDYVRAQISNDSIASERLSEYRNNQLLMSGAGAASLRTGRVATAGSATPGREETRMVAASTAFSGSTMRAPFAAGSSVLAAQQAGINGPLDPNAVVASATASSSLGSLQAEQAGQAGDSGSGQADENGSGQAGESGIGSGHLAGISPISTSQISTVLPASIPMSYFVKPPTSTAIGPGPGDLFPDVTVSLPSATGFMDTTTGTAGLASMNEDTGLSPFSRSYDEAAASPFASISSETSSFLHPSLHASPAGLAGPAPAVSVNEIARKVRMHAIISNPGAPLPSPFQQRAMLRAYERQNNNRRVSRYPRLTAPSIRPEAPSLESERRPQ